MTHGKTSKRKKPHHEITRTLASAREKGGNFSKTHELRLPTPRTGISVAKAAPPEAANGGTVLTCVIPEPMSQAVLQVILKVAFGGAAMAWDGMDAFARALEQRAELTRVRRRVDPLLEVSAIADRVMKAGGPALLFEDVGGSRFPLLINAFGSRSRMSWALGVDDLDVHDSALAELVQVGDPSGAGGAWLQLARKLPELAHVPPRSAASGPCQDVVRVGEEVDLDVLPILTSWPLDGGPFITLPQVVTRDPETGVRNIGCYRMQKLDRRTTAMHWQVHKTGARHFRRAKELGHRRMEVAVALGGDPVMTYAATAPLPDGVDEWMFAGFLRGRAVSTVKCKTLELEVPSESDFVLEGYVDPQEELAHEGPFGDHTGYYTPVGLFPRFHVTALTHRSNAVYPATLVGPPPMERCVARKGDRTPFSASSPHALPRNRGHEPAGRRGFSQPRPHLDKKAVPPSRVTARAWPLGGGPDVVLEGDLRPRRGRERARCRSGGVAAARKPRPETGPVVRPGADRRARSR